MKKINIFYAVGGFFLGIIISLFVMYKAAPGIMMLEDQAIEKSKLKSAIDDLSKEIKSELKKSIWD